MKKIKKIDIAKFILYIILLIPFFKSPYLSYIYPQAQIFYEALKILSLVIIFLLLIINKNISKINILIIVYMLMLFFSTYINHAAITEAISLIINVLAICFIVDYGIKKDTKVFLNSFEFLLSSLIYINLLTIIMYPTGMYTVHTSSYTTYLSWFLGYKNNHILFLLPAILISFINSYYTKNRLSLRNYLLLIVSFITLILNQSSTSLIGIIIIVAMLLLQRIIKKSKLLNIFTYLIIYLSAFFGIVIFRIQNYFSYIIVNILHKDITFTGRIYIWDYVTNFIKQKKIFGYGIENSVVRLKKTNIWQSYHAHDQILEVIYKSGIVGLIIYSIIVFMSFKELYKYKENKVAQIISVVVFAYLIMMITEAYSFENIMYLFVICFNVRYLIHNNPTKKVGDVGES